MYIKKQVLKCEYTNRTYIAPVAGAGAGVLVKHDTGGYAIVMVIGPEFIKEHNIKVLSHKECVDYITLDSSGYVDF